MAPKKQIQLDRGFSSLVTYLNMGKDFPWYNNAIIPVIVYGDEIGMGNNLRFYTLYPDTGRQFLWFNK